MVGCYLLPEPAIGTLGVLLSVTPQSFYKGITSEKAEKEWDLTCVSQHQTQRLCRDTRGGSHRESHVHDQRDSKKRCRDLAETSEVEATRDSKHMTVGIKERGGRPCGDKKGGSHPGDRAHD